MKKKTIALLSAALIAGLLTSCGSSSPDGSASSAAAAKGPVTLTIWVTSREQDDYYKARDEKFQKANPHITLHKIVKEGDPGNEFYQAVAAGTAPDLCKVSFTMMDKYMKAGILEPLNKYTEQWKEWPNFTKEYVDMFTVNGQVQAVPRSVAPMLFGYNKALFKAAGIKNPPRTWEEALKDAKLINDPANQIIGYATLAAEWTEWFFQYYVWQAGGDLTRQNTDDTITLTFTDSAVIEAAKYYQKLVSEGVLQSDRTLKFIDLVSLFGQGKIGMMPFAGDWVVDAIKQGIDPNDIGLCLPPAGPSGESATAIAGECYVINAKATQEKKDAAWEYIKFINSKENTASELENNASKGAANPIIIPRDDMKITDYYELPAEYADVLTGVKTIGRMEFYGKADFGIYVDRAVQKILMDPNADPKTEFKAAQTLAENEALANFNKMAKSN